MVYLTMVRTAGNTDREDVLSRSRRWWNEGERPDGFRTLAAYSSIGSGGPDVYVFETDSQDDLRKLVSFWRGVVEFEFHPAFDALEGWRKQGMNVV